MTKVWVPCYCGGNCGQCGGAGDWIEDGKDSKMSTDMGYEEPDPTGMATALRATAKTLNGMPDATAAQRRKSGVVRAIILSGWIMTLATMMAIVGASLWLTLTGKIVPETLGNWTGVALGFLFGNFSSIVANYIKEEADST